MAQPQNADIIRGCLQIHLKNTATLLILFSLLSTFPPALASKLPCRRNLLQPNLEADPKLQRTAHERGDDSPPPLEVFEVSKPLHIPADASETCTQTLLHWRVFSNTFQKPPTLVRYSPPPCKAPWSRVLLRWRANCSGRQYDRISGVWVGRVEIFRTCTAEPVKQPGITWTVEKDVTKFATLFSQPQLVAVELANVVDGPLTGIYNVTLSLHFFTSKTANHDGYGYATGPADVVLALSPKLFSPEYWFRIRDQVEAQMQPFRVPRNAYRAVLEVCLSFHERDEFWYNNPPNEYLKASNLTDAGNGAFREVLVSLDGLIAGVVYPFPVIYTGGVNPYFWRPVSGIGSFVMPSYDVDITAFLGKLVDGEEHEIAVSVTNALPVWLLGLNLHVWVDETVVSTTGGLVSHFGTSEFLTTKSEFLALDGTFLIKAWRKVAYSGWLQSRFGNLTTSGEHSFRFSHSLVFSERGNGNNVHQESVSESKVTVRDLERCVVYDHRVYRFPLRLSMHGRPYGDENENYAIKASVDHAWEEERHYQARDGGAGGSYFSSLVNRQQSKGSLFLRLSGEMIRGVGTTKQALRFDGSEGCYFRSLGVGSNGSFLFDRSGTKCTE